ncbi:MAG: Flp family type IVb pilin [Chloroflexota bacterium]|nr:Flp family type IVb pilin [Chloroflexota bacterium]
MSQFVALFDRIVREEEGQDLVEYAMLVALIAVVCVAGVTLLGTEINGFFTALSGLIPLP